MTSLLRRLIKGLHPSQADHSVMLAGLDNAGKTTLLYWFKPKEVVSTLPTIGVNIETANIRVIPGRTLHITGCDAGGGCTNVFPLLRMYLRAEEAVVWMVDSSDKERLSDSVEALKQLILVPNETPRNIPILILANKTDAARAMPVEELRAAFADATSGHVSSLFPISLVKASGNSITEAFRWLCGELDGARTENLAQSDKSTPNVPAIAMPNPRSTDELTLKLESWFTRIEGDLPEDEFLNKFQSFSLPSWDHYTHIRIAFTLLSKYGRQKGKNMIFKGLEDYIKNSPQSQGRSFHFTMTYFWVQIVHFGISSIPQKPSSAAEKPDGPLEEFARFLLVNPYVVDGGLWLDYYSKEVLMSPKAKAEMVLPDKKPLPNLVVRDAIKGFGA